MTSNAQYRLAARPEGLPEPSDWENTGKLVLALHG
jgi:hypothetical protein